MIKREKTKCQTLEDVYVDSVPPKDVRRINPFRVKAVIVP